jgi:hypothetical protein
MLRSLLAEVLVDAQEAGGLQNFLAPPQIQQEPELTPWQKLAEYYRPGSGYRAAGGSTSTDFANQQAEHEQRVGLFEAAINQFGGASEFARTATTGFSPDIEGASEFARTATTGFSPDIERFQDSRGFIYEVSTPRGVEGAGKITVRPVLPESGSPQGGLFALGNPVRRVRTGEGESFVDVNRMRAGAAVPPGTGSATGGSTLETFAPRVTTGEGKDVAADTSMLTRLNETEKMFRDLITRASDAERIGVSAGRDLPLIGGKIDEFILSRTNPETSLVASRLDNIADVLLRLRSGAQINEQEYQRLRKLLPKIGEGAGQALQKFTEFRKEFMGILKTKAQLEPALFTDEVLQNSIGMSRADLLGRITEEDDDAAARALLDEIKAGR